MPDEPDAEIEQISVDFERGRFAKVSIRDLGPGVKPRGTKSALEGGIQQKEVMPSIMPLW